MKSLLRLATTITCTAEDGALVLHLTPRRGLCTSMTVRLTSIRADFTDVATIETQPLIRAIGDGVVHAVRDEEQSLRFEGPGWSYAAAKECASACIVGPAPTYSLTARTADLSAILRSVAPCIGDETRYGLNGIHLEMDGDQLTAIATNGSQLRRISRPAEGTWNPPATDNVIPSDPLLALLPLCGPSVSLCYTRGPERPAHIPTPKAHFERGWIHLSSGPMSATFRSQGGEFPRWREVIPQRSCRTQIEVDTAILRRALDRFSHHVYVTLRAETDSLILSDDALTMHIPAILHGPVGACSYTASLLRRTLAGAKRVRLDIVPDLNAGLVCPVVDGEVQPWTDIIMPVRMD